MEDRFELSWSEIFLKNFLTDIGNTRSTRGLKEINLSYFSVGALYMIHLTNSATRLFEGISTNLYCEIRKTLILSTPVGPGCCENADTVSSFWHLN